MDLVSGDLEIREVNMKWNCENNVVTDDIINDVEAELKIKFPRDFVAIIKQYDGDIQYQIK